MIETTNIMYTRATMIAGGADGANNHYRAYYRELVTRGASRAARNSRLEEIKAARRRARREKWLKGIKSLASVLISSEAVG